MSRKEQDLLFALETAAAALAVIANNFPEAKNFALFNFRKAREAINSAEGGAVSLVRNGECK